MANSDYRFWDKDCIYFERCDTIDKNDITGNGQIISSTRDENGDTKKHTRYRKLLTSR